MRIGILLHPYDEDKPAGLGRFILELSKALIESDKDNEYVLFVKKKPRKLPNISGSNWKLEVLDNSPLWLGWAFRRAWRADVYIFNTPILPFLLPRGKTIVIALDFAYHYLPSATIKDFLHTKMLGWYHGRSLRRADHIVAISRTTEREIKKLYGISGEKITVVYPGFNKICGLAEEEINVPSRFFLFVGVLKPRKNPLRAVEAFVEFHKKYPDYSLVVAGKGSGPYYEQIQSYIREHNAQSAVVFTGFITDGQLAYLYKRTLAFVFPSILEGGFCLPVLEAMDCGVPTITSGQGPYESMEEMTGDAAILVDPLNAGDIARAMERVAIENDLRSALTRKGLERVKRFSWEKAGRELLDVIYKI